MCVISFVGVHFGQRWPQVYPNVPSRPTDGTEIARMFPSAVTREEFDALKAEVEECKRLLIEAKKIDEALGTPDCQMEEKVATIRRFAEFVGVDLADVLA